MRHRPLRTALGAGIAAGLLVGAAPAAQADAHGCVVGDEQRAAVRDQIRTLKGDLRGDRLSADERAALRAAVAETVQAVHERNVARKAVRREFVALAHRLGDAETAEERTAIRAEMRALRLQLTDGRLTKAERRTLREQAHDLRRSLQGRLTEAQKDAVKADLKRLRAQLHCR